MISRIAERVVDELIKHKAIEEKERAYCQYGVEIFISNLSGILVTILAAMVTGLYLELAIYFLVFAWNRQYCGGLHLEHYGTCFLCFTFITISCVFVVSYWEVVPLPIWKMIIVTAGVVFGICAFAFTPIENVYKPLTTKEKCKYARIVRLTYPIQLLILTILAHVCFSLAVAYVFSILVVALLMILAKLTERKDRAGNSLSE